MKAEKNYCSGYWFFSAGDKIVVLNDSFCDENQTHYDIDGNGIAHQKDKEMVPLDEEEMKRVRRLITNPIDNVSSLPFANEGYAMYKKLSGKWFYVNVKISKIGIKMKHKDVAKVVQYGVEELQLSSLEKNSAY